MFLYYFWRWLILLGLGFLVYAKTFGFGFVFDDYIFIVNNPFIKNFGNFHLMWQEFPLTRLVGMCSFALNYHFNQLNPAGYHLFNFIVHVAAASLVWALTVLLFRMSKILPTGNKIVGELPFFVALLFLVHPGQTQAVTYITQRFESMATLFYLATIYVYVQARLARGFIYQMRLWGLVGVLMILGLMTKEVVITVPLMMLAVEYIFFPSANRRKLYLILAVAVPLLYLLFSKMLHTDLKVFWQIIPSESHDGDTITTGTYLLTQLRVFLTFLRLLILPVHQNLDYDYPLSSNLLHSPLTLVGLLVIGSFIFFIVKYRRQFPLMAFGLNWMLITFSINLVPRANVIFEHKLYLISFGFFLTIVGALDRFVKDKRIVMAVCCSLIGIWTLMSIERNKVWADELTLWQNILKESPNKSRVNSNLGRVYGSMGKNQESIYYLTRAITIAPDNITYEDRGVMYARQGEIQKALEDLNKSISMEPSYAPPYVKRSWVYQLKHDNQAALDDLARAIKLEPHFSDAYIERGMLWTSLKQYGLALEDFNQAENIEPLSQEVQAYKEYCLKQLVR